MRIFASLALIAVACGGPSKPETVGPDPSSVGKAEPDSGSASAKSEPSPSKPDAPKADPAPAPITAEQADKVMARFVALLDEAAKGLTAAKGDCGKMVAVLDGWVDAHTTEARAIFLQLGRAQEHKAVLQKYVPRMQQTQATFKTQVTPCGKDPELQRAAYRFLAAANGKPVPPKTAPRKEPAKPVPGNQK